ncbi:hypothetical protein VNO78_08630 [Psophocarpus tetragonolobus]|uniref:Uncharacterized protein n=1 Tax=Psophocarpus tetragonolobus TaxID=3891 RepID=A0AAN9T636_PSOTE
MSFPLTVVDIRALRLLLRDDIPYLWIWRWVFWLRPAYDMGNMDGSGRTDAACNVWGGDSASISWFTIVL